MHTKEKLSADKGNEELRTQLIEDLNEVIEYSNVENNVRPGNEPFILKGDGKVGIILFHGFSASPHEVKELAEFLHDNLNATVYAPLISCHGTDYRKFGDCSYKDWQKGAELAYDDMSYLSDEVFVGGISLGANLALDISKKHDVKGIITIGAPIEFKDKTIKYAFIGSFFINTLPNYKLSEEEMNYYYYNRSLKAVAELYHYVNLMKQDINEISAPIIIFQSDNDKTINPISAFMIYRDIRSQDKRIVAYNSDSHIIINTKDKQDIFNDILRFVEEQK
jgi:carboxylesterase